MKGSILIVQTLKEIAATAKAFYVESRKQGNVVGYDAFSPLFLIFHFYCENVG
jgi:hypothetical protein